MLTSVKIWFIRKAGYPMVTHGSVLIHVIGNLNLLTAIFKFLHERKVLIYI